MHLANSMQMLYINIQSAMKYSRKKFYKFFS